MSSNVNSLQVSSGAEKTGGMPADLSQKSTLKRKSWSPLTLNDGYTAEVEKRLKATPRTEPSQVAVPRDGAQASTAAQVPQKPQAAELPTILVAPGNDNITVSQQHTGAASTQGSRRQRTAADVSALDGLVTEAQQATRAFDDGIRIFEHQLGQYTIAIKVAHERLMLERRTALELRSRLGHEKSKLLNTTAYAGTQAGLGDANISAKVQKIENRMDRHFTNHQVDSLWTIYTKEAEKADPCTRAASK